MARYNFKTCIALLTARRLLLSDSAHTDCFRPSARRRSYGCVVVVMIVLIFNVVKEVGAREGNVQLYISRSCAFGFGGPLFAVV